MFEVTGSDIAALNDEDLRSLVGKLCEAELRLHGLSTSGVTWGGNQNASDGGIDVRIRFEGGAPPGGFVPRASVGFQVKKTDFTPRLIRAEMRPEDKIRDSISQLIDERGAYIIASSGSDTSNTALSNRLTAMRSAVTDNSGHTDLHLDFYDRNRLATWARNHPGLVVWVRKKIGRSIPGWQPYSSWAASPDGVQDEYLFDDKARLHIGIADENGVNVAHGIDHIRDVLRHPRKVVRLAGLSGVGKTRLVQALFDARIGNKPLHEALVVYTDMNDHPSPQPTSMLSDLIALQMRAIVVVDNCAPDLHRRITEVCQTSNSLVSTITVEYDVQEDEPEGTEVYRLEPSSVGLVCNLVVRRFPAMADPDVDRIAEFSGGNARIALALANTLEHGESVAGLRDEELFRRLFHQRQAPDDSLLRSAQACALLYSFQGESLNGDDAELPKIGALVDMDASQLYAKVAQLKQRDLVQRRSVWRAILPHAIANRLAIMALREISFEQIEQQFNTNRLLRSFSRRLGYLHESEEAKRIAEKWLGKAGLLADIARLNEDGLAMFDNVAPVAPDAAIAAIERVLSGPDADHLIKDQQRRDRIGTLLRLIAYDASLFDRCVAAMTILALAEQTAPRTHPVEDALKSLFHIVYSGTHAIIDQRVGFVEGLLSATESEKRILGLRLLDALFETDYFSPSYGCEFGARVRDYGYSPNSRQENENWYAASLQLARRFVSKNDENAAVVRSMIARSICNLWFMGSKVQEQFEAVAAETAANGYWQEGWIATRHILARLGEEEKQDTAAVGRLHKLENILRPKNIIEQVRAVALSSKWRALDYAEMDDDESKPETAISANEKADATAEELGKAVCGDQGVFAVLLPDLVQGDGARLYRFGRGLALASVNHCNTWEQLTNAVAQTEESKRNGEALCGFLSGLSTIDEQLCEALLEEALTHQILGVWFPGLQSSVTITPAGADRLKRAARLGNARPGTFRFLGWRRSADAVTAHDLQSIIMSLAKKEQGYDVAIHILSVRLRSVQEEKEDYPSELIDAGRQLLTSPDFSVRYNTYDYDLQIIVNACLRGADGSDAAKKLCEQIKQGLSDHTFRAYNFDLLLQSIFELQPRIALDVFFCGESQNNCCGLYMINFDRFHHHQRNPLDKVSNEELLRWCDEDSVRYTTMSKVISYDIACEGGVEWTPLAMEMLKRAPDPLTVLKTFVDRFHPRSWSGSLAAIIESRLGLLDRLGALNIASLDEYVTGTRSKLVDENAERRNLEDDRDGWRDERFE